MEKLSQHRIPWLLVAAIAVCYLYPFPYFDKLRSAQEMPRLLLTQQIVEEGTFALNSRLKELGSWNDLSIGPDGRYYANKSPGPSFAAIPAYVVARTFGARSIKALTWSLRVGAVTLPSILFLPILFLLMGEFTESVRARRAALVAFALGSPVFVYSMLLMGHQLAGICLATSFWLLLNGLRANGKARLGRVALAGLIGGFAPMMDYQATLVVPALGIYLLTRSDRRVRDAAVFVACSSPGPALLALYHYKCFGSPFRISYGYGLDTAPKEGVLGFIGPNFSSLHNILTTPSNGLITLSPWIGIAALGFIAARRHRAARQTAAEVWFSVAVVMLYVLFVGSMLPYMARGGWSAGARQLVATMPFLACLAAAGFAELEEREVLRGIVVGGVLSGMFVFTVAATTYPHWPDALVNPLFDLSLPLLLEGYAVHSIGTALGMSGLWSLAPHYAIVAATAYVGLLHRSPRVVTGLGLAIATATAVVVLYAAMPRTGAYKERAWNFVTSTWEPRTP